MSEKKNRQRFWLCWVDASGVPKVRHWKLEDAKAEAERLARETGRDVFLLVATVFVRLKNPEPPTVWQETTEEQFAILSRERM